MDNRDELEAMLGGDESIARTAARQSKPWEAVPHSGGMPCGVDQAIIAASAVKFDAKPRPPFDSGGIKSDPRNPALPMRSHKKMSQQDLLKFHDWATQKMRNICEMKNSDYSGAVENDCFTNFTRVEMLGIATTEQGFLTRMLDKICRVTTFARKGTLAVKEESATDALLDLANYCILFAAYLEEKKALTP